MSNPMCQTAAALRPGSATAVSLPRPQRPNDKQRCGIPVSTALRYSLPCHLDGERSCPTNARLINRPLTWGLQPRRSPASYQVLRPAYQRRREGEYFPYIVHCTVVLSLSGLVLQYRLSLALSFILFSTVPTAVPIRHPIESLCPRNKHSYLHLFVLLYFRDLLGCQSEPLSRRRPGRRSLTLLRDEEEDKAAEAADPTAAYPGQVALVTLPGGVRTDTAFSNMQIRRTRYNRQLALTFNLGSHICSRSDLCLSLPC